MRIESYGTDESIDVIDTAWLRSEIAKLRSQISPEASLRIDSQIWKQWRLAVGLYQLDETLKPVRDLRGDLVPSKRKTCTKRQAALLVLISLWKPMKRPLVQKAIASHLKVDQLNKLNLPRLFDEWVDATGAIEGEPLLTKIRQYKGPTLEQLSNLSGELLGEKVSVYSLARKIKAKSGKQIGQIRKNDPVPKHLAVYLIHWILMLAQQNNRDLSNQFENSYLGLPPGS